MVCAVLGIQLYNALNVFYIDIRHGNIESVFERVRVVLLGREDCRAVTLQIEHMNVHTIFNF